MRIIQITDLHIYPTDEIINGVDTRKNFLNTLKAIIKIPFDKLVITGDLCFIDGDIKVYEWIKDQLQYFKINNYNIIGGNHDGAKQLSEVFDLKEDVIEDELYYFVEPNLIFLDTIKGYCSDKQLSWLKDQIEQIEGNNPIIFMHHPPFKSGVPHMDSKYAFKQEDLFAEICNLNNNASFVFCGHYHNEISVVKSNINMFITPSTYVQISMFHQEFEADHNIPAFRIIDIDNNQIKTTVRYVFD